MMDFFADALITMDFNYYLLMRKFEKFKRRLDETLKTQTSGYIIYKTSTVCCVAVLWQRRGTTITLTTGGGSQ